jgi:hypothetical protein
MLTLLSCAVLLRCPQPYFEHAETGEVVWEIPNRGWVGDRAAMMRRAAERHQRKIEENVEEV